MTMPENIRPMLTTLVSEPFDDKGWAFEIKYDGYRIIAYIDRGAVTIKTKNNVDYTDKLRPITDALRKWPVSAVIDGEVVVLNSEGVSDFGALMSWKRGCDVPIYYYVFDLLWLNGKDYMSMPLAKRKAALKALLPRSRVIRFTSDIHHLGIAAFNMAVEKSLEGIVAKKLDSPYTPGTRSKHWLKIKTYKEEEFVIVGYTRPFALLLGTYKDDQLQFAGDVGTGFSDKQVKDILSRITVVKKCPLVREPVFKAGPFGKKIPQAVIWCRPQLVCRVRYLEAGRGSLRHASFKGLTG